MRDRLVAVLVGITVAVVALYGLPRAYMLADYVQSQEERKADRSIDLLAVVLEQRSTAGEPVTPAFLEPLRDQDESLEYVAPDGAVVRAGPDVPGADPADIVRSRDLGDGGRVTLVRGHDLVEGRVSDALLPLVLLGLVLVALAATVGFVLARRLTRPFAELADIAESVGAGRFDVDVPHYRIPEAEAIGQALRHGSAQLASNQRREREFAVRAGHELRTPIAALRLQLEDLSLWPQTPPDVAAELDGYLPELDRLSAAITEFLDIARSDRLVDAEDVDLGELLAEGAERWRARAGAEGRSLLVTEGPEVRVRVPRDVATALLDLLVEDVLGAGQGPMTVAVQGGADYARVSMGSQAPRAEEDLVEVGGGPRAAASVLAQSVGGHVSAADHSGTTVVLTLPVAPTRHP